MSDIPNRNVKKITSDNILKYLFRDSRELPFPSLLEEMFDYSETKSETIFIEKVKRVHLKCLLKKKTKLADKIYKKYQKHLSKNNHSDFTMAFELSLRAKKKINNKSS